MPPKLFSFTHFRKNASASPFVSHTYKKRWGWGCRISSFAFRVSVFELLQAASGHRCEAKLESTRQPTNLRAETLRLKGLE